MDQLCPICGMNPCSYQCPNSEYYYSPEQERYDDMMDDGSDDHRERYAATVEAEQYADDPIIGFGGAPDFPSVAEGDPVFASDLVVVIDADEFEAAQNDPLVREVLANARAAVARSTRLDLDPDDIPF